MNSVMKKIFALLLAASMIFGMAACGSSANTGSASAASTAAPTATPGSTSAPASSAPAGMVYNSEFKDLVFPDGSVEIRAAVSDGVLCSANVVVGDNTPEGVTPEYEGQYAVYGTKLYFADFDGNVTTLEQYQPMQTELHHENGVCGTYVTAMTAKDSDHFVSLDAVYENWSDNTEAELYSDEWYNAYHYEENYYIRVLDGTGAEVTCCMLAPEVGSFYPYGIVMDKDDNIVIAGDSCVMVLNLNGELVSQIPVDNAWVDSVAKAPDGSVYALYSDGTSYKMYMAPIDIENSKLGEMIPLPENCYTVITGGDDYDFYFTSGATFYGFNLGDETAQQVLNWISCDVNANNICAVYFMGDTLRVLSAEYDNEGNASGVEVANITQVPADSVPQKQYFTLAVNYLNYYLQNELIAFNRSSSTVHIDVKKYSDVSVLQTEIMAGNVPDLVSLDAVNETALAARGLLVDMYPYIDADPELSRDDFFTNILTMLETDGHLYNVTPSYNVYTVAGATSIVGSGTGWTYDELYAAEKNMPDGCDLFDVYTTRDEILKNGLYMDADVYYNLLDGTVNFKNESFTQLLEFAARFPAEYDWNDYNYQTDDSWTRISTGEQMLTSMYLADFMDVALYDSIFGGDANFIGLPCTSGSGNMAVTSSGIALTTACSDPDAAWQFLRRFYTADYEDSLTYNLPLRRDSFAKRIEAAMEVNYEKDAAGNYVLDENGEKIPEAVYNIGIGTENISVYSLTQAQADKIYAVVENVTRHMETNTELFDIVNEEAQAYFAGQKSAEEVADIIQSRAGIYLREQM